MTGVRVEPTALHGVLRIVPAVYPDDRGCFLETFQHRKYLAAGVGPDFVQDNLSRSRRGVLRGLHFQEPNPQGKLVSVTAGAVYDVVVDVRRGSPTFGKWLAEELTSENRTQLWIPEGFAHGFCALSETADFLYKCTAYYDAGSERAIRWNDPDLGIPWPVESPLLSPKDRDAPRLRDAPHLPIWTPDR